MCLSNKFPQNTNVVHFFNLLSKDCDAEQLTYYQTGVGTYTNPGIFTPVTMWFAKLFDNAFAWYVPNFFPDEVLAEYLLIVFRYRRYLSAHVMGGYRFLMKNYRAGDKIALFGFSRGAYTARALAGMLTKVGLLQRDNDEHIPFAYKIFADRKDKEQADRFKHTFCRHIEVIDFIGVW